jgi:thiol-disulfide isomerase/thioredoxin
LFIFLALIFTPALAQGKINLYFFYGDGCPHCAKEEKFLDKLEKENANILIKRYEVWHDRANADLLRQIASELKLDVRGVPLLIVGEKTIAGYYSDETTGAEIRSLISQYALTGCEDIVAPIIGNGSSGQTCVHGCEAGDENCLHNCGCEADAGSTVLPDRVALPILGEVAVKDLSLPLLTVLIAALDGFNPCAMWVLLFLISLLIGMKDKKRMWILGTAFIAASALVYFLFLSAWLNLFLFLGFVWWLRISIGLVALGSGGYHLYDYYQNRDGCKVVTGERRQRVFERLRQVVSEKKFLLALGGIIILAFAVNLVCLPSIPRCWPWLNCRPGNITATWSCTFSFLCWTTC